MRIHLFHSFRRFGDPTIRIRDLEQDLEDNIFKRIHANEKTLKSIKIQYNAGKIDEETFRLIEQNTCCSPGACNMMGTANTMASIVEAMGLSLPQCAI